MRNQIIAYIFATKQLHIFKLSFMRKLKLQVQISIDGFICGPNGEMDWLNFNWTPDIMSYVAEITEPVDLILLGKNLATGFIPHWAAAAKNPESAEPGAQKMAETAKVVFSSTLKKTEWENTRIAGSNIRDEINTLKNQSGKDIIAYGGAQLVSSLIKEKLIDELYLFVNPAALGKGMPIFQQIESTQHFQLIHSKAFECGIVVLVYKPN